MPEALRPGHQIPCRMKRLGGALLGLIDSPAPLEAYLSLVIASRTSWTARSPE